MASTTYFNNNNASVDLWGTRGQAFLLQNLVKNHLASDSRPSFRINPEINGRTGPPMSRR
ncbi:hypothetical protein ABIE45_004302 [Methylobacterium sp. OAE515]